MEHFLIRAITLIAVSAPLSACSSFLGINFARHASRPPVAAPAPAEASATDLGRRQLAEGQTGLAIEAFQRALAGGEPMAPAVNGLGVAYARLERFDLARRYFEQAIAGDPANSRYSDNLARLMRSPALALRRDGDIARTALKAAAPAPVTAVRPASALGKLERVSRGEVRIATAPPQAAPAAVDSRFKPLVRFSIAEPVQAPLRIVLPEAKPADAATVAKSEAASAPR